MIIYLKTISIVYELSLFSHSIEGGMPNLLCFSLFTVFSYERLVQGMGVVGWVAYYESQIL